jgi:pimeloyl-ACP methyl ester carboxylesterase
MSRGTEQAWLLDGFLRSGGLDTLHPQAYSGFQTYMGLDIPDIDRTFERVQSAPMMAKAWAEVGGELERKSAYYASRGYLGAARETMLRAVALYGRAQYSIFSNADPRKAALRGRMDACMDVYIGLAENPIQRGSVEFEGKQVHYLVHVPKTAVFPAPVMFAIPGMDQIKEDFNRLAQREFCARGYIVVVADGPGQGRTLFEGLTVTPDNYERAISAVLDAVLEDERADASRIAAYGVSMGSYWAVRVAAHEPRLKVTATNVGHYGATESAFDRAQPSFKANFMYMSGYTDVARFDEEITSRIELASVAPKIRCPVLLSLGEFDELTTLDAAFDLYEQIPSAKELVVWEQEFHSMGGVVAESLAWALDWIDRGLSGGIPADHAEQVYMRRNGDVQIGDARPGWGRPKGP